MTKNQWLIIGGLSIAVLCVCSLLGLVMISTTVGTRYDRWTCAQVIQRLRDSGLEAEDTRPLTAEDYGLAPMTASQAMRFMIPSLGPERGGRVFAFASQDDLDRMRRYYEELGRSSAAFFSWVLVKDNMLIQIGGDLPESNARQYDLALQSLGGAIPRMTRYPLPSKTPTATLYPTPTRVATFTPLPTLTLAPTPSRQPAFLVPPVTFAPTPTRPGAQQFVPIRTATRTAIPPQRTCCKTCGPNGKACGDSCIALSYNCTKPPGCA